MSQNRPTHPPGAGLSMMIESPDQQDLDDFTALYVRHYEQLLRLAVLLVGDMAAAEDVVQEAFIRVHRRLDRLGQLLEGAS
jgi:DNA-directed RNA polymerase specialized sigma24 family protein